MFSVFVVGGSSRRREGECHDKLRWDLSGNKARLFLVGSVQLFLISLITLLIPCLFPYKSLELWKHGATQHFASDLPLFITPQRPLIIEYILSIITSLLPLFLSISLNNATNPLSQAATRRSPRSSWAPYPPTSPPSTSLRVP